MHVPRCRISKANVCPYWGREIPGWQELGLDANRQYRMYRDPQALAEAARTFNNVPLLMDHVIVTADKMDPQLIAGTVSNPVFEHPYLYGDVTAWTRDAIEGIETNEQKELSCAYRYVASMIPGTTGDGVPFDGRMMGPIQANHVALVAKGRAGPDVVVADEALRMNKPRLPRYLSVLHATLSALVKPEALAALDSALDEDLGEDACLTDEERTAARDQAMKDMGKDSLTDVEERAAYQRAAKDKRAKDAKVPGDPEGGAPNPNPAAAKDAAPGTAVGNLTVTVDVNAPEVKAALDAAIADATKGMVTMDAAQQMATDAVAAVHALYAARADVEDRVGVITLDTAEAVYRCALDKLTIPHKDVPASALAALFAGVKATAVAQDAAPPAPAPRVSEMFPIAPRR